MSQTNFKWPTERISLGCSYRVRNGTGKKHLLRIWALLLLISFKEKKN